MYLLLVRCVHVDAWGKRSTFGLMVLAHRSASTMSLDAGLSYGELDDILIMYDDSHIPDYYRSVRVEVPKCIVKGIVFRNERTHTMMPWQDSNDTG